jgi:tetratricopeptide (TPR) repeat protein
MPDDVTPEIEPSSPPEDHRPPRRVIGGSSAGWFILAAAGLFFLVLTLSLWYALAPVTLARLIGRLADRPLVVESLSLTVDRRPLEMPPDSALVVTPRQKIALGHLATNRWLNYDLSLASPDFDIAAVTGGQAAAPADFLDISVFRPGVVLLLKALDNDRPAAEFKIMVQYEARDYAFWAPLTNDPLRRAEIYRKILVLDPKYPGADGELAASLAEAGQPEQAALVYEEMLDRLPGEAGAAVLDRLLELYDGLGRRDRQAAALKRLMDWNREEGRPAAAVLRQALAGYSREGRLNQAEEILRELLPGAPPEDVADIWGELALLSRRQGNAQGEIAALKSLAALAPPERAREIWSGLLDLYETIGDDSGRLDALKALAGILPAGPEKANAHKAIGLISAQAGDYRAAETAYQEALKLEPEDTSTRLNLARVQGLSGRRGDYRAGLEDLAARFPDRLEYLEELAGSLREDGLWPQAQKHYQILADARPDDLSARLTLMELMERNKDQAGLMAQYELLTSMRPDDQVALYNYGALLFDRKNWDEAALVFHKLLALNVDEEAAREYLLAIYQRQGKNSEMLEQALALYRLDPSKVVYRAFVLNTYENAKDWPNFSAAAAECAALREDDPEGWRQLARGQANLNQKTDAAQSLWRAAEASQDQAEPWLTVGAAYSDLGDPARSREAYQKALDLDPGNKKAIQAIQELDRRAGGRERGGLMP